MARDKHVVEDLSARRIIGFACNQGFVFFLFYMGLNRSFDVAGFSFERAELFGTLAFMVVGFFVVSRVRDALRPRLFLRPLLYVYAVVLGAASLVPAMLPGAAFVALPLEWVFLGMPAAVLLTAWGMTFGEVPSSVSVPEVFLGSLVGALVCLAFSLASDSMFAMIVFALLPLASVVNIQVPASALPRSRAPMQASVDDARKLSLKVMAGTVCFGMAAGFMETYSTDPGTAALPTYPLTMVLFGAFLIGSLSLLLSDGFGRGAALNKAYRLAVFLIMMGLFVVPWPALAASIMPGKTVVLAGYLGLEAVLVSLFLVLAEITASPASTAFSRGFTALFGGEMAGVLFANLGDALVEGGSTPYAVVVLAGALVLFSYIFLFTERDFDALSAIVTVRDTFEDTCVAISERYALSRRESEILALALRGRTSERIANELTVTKSTVDTHLRRIYAKTGVHSRQELLDLGESVSRELA